MIKKNVVSLQRKRHTLLTPTSYQKLYKELSQCYQALISSEADLRQSHQKLSGLLEERDQHILQLQAQTQQQEQEHTQLQQHNQQLQQQQQQQQLQQHNQQLQQQQQQHQNNRLNTHLFTRQTDKLTLRDSDVDVEKKEQ
ncbi:circadian locomoter output cycles protein kaput-like [Pseudochaenichthys georgianus]|uniref:circadian locomoter output cycles protein kaput-like n=1 Tax=Pseudochaenichthys georgianus TaxID=52239 RepID=UPI0039C1B940